MVVFSRVHDVIDYDVINILDALHRYKLAVASGCRLVDASY